MVISVNERTLGEIRSLSTIHDFISVTTDLEASIGLSHHFTYPSLSSPTAADSSNEALTDEFQTLGVHSIHGIHRDTTHGVYGHSWVGHNGSRGS